MTTQPKVSILIPVYNTARYLPKCMASVLNQTLKEIEIIVVNDASPDNAAEVLAGYAAQDSRVKVVTHEKNGGILAARLSGIAAASGEYLIFLDADDYLDVDTARACYAKARKTGADMIHFCFDVRIGHRKKTLFARKVEKRINPYSGKLLGKQVFEGAFVNYLYSWNICGKFIAAEICRKAAAALPPGYYIMAEDFCFYTMMSWFATHYEPLFKKCYYYGLDIGVSSYLQTDYAGFLRKCTVFDALTAVKTFLCKQGVFEQYRVPYELQERRILKELLDRWEHQLIQYDRTRALSYMFEHYSPAGLIRTMIDCFDGKENQLAALTGTPEIFCRKPDGHPKVSRIGLYLESAVNGREYVAEMVRIAEEWLRSGLKVSLLTPDENPALPDGMDLIQVPAGLTAESTEALLPRVGFWCGLREKYGIDAIAHGALENPRSLFDAFCIRLSGLRLLAFPLTGGQVLADASLGDLMVKMRFFQLSDVRVVRSLFDQRFFTAVGLPCVEVAPRSGPRPEQKDSHAGQNLLWLGNLNSPDAEVVVAAWAKLAGQFPGRRLCMLGRTRFPGSDRAVRLAAELMGIHDTLEIRVSPEEFSDRLEACGLFFTSSDDPGLEIYAQIAMETGVPVHQCRQPSPEELAEELSGILNGTRRPRIPAESAPREAVPWEAILNWHGDTGSSAGFLDLFSRYQLRFEPFVLLPANRGASFIKLYRKLDSLVYRILPSSSPRRAGVYNFCRYFLHHLKKKGWEK